MSNKQVILTGIRANNDLHIGNYFGAILPTVDMARNYSDEYQINLFVPDLHSFTTPIDHSLLQAQITNTLKIFTASGLPLNNPDVYIYRQSYISAHSELTWILDCFTGFGQLARMTQFKDKSGLYDFPKNEKTGETGEPEFLYSNESADKATTVGLFNYPVLMASDILLYNATYVPVGDDQTQHLEFTRDIAQRMNSKFGDIFTVPFEVKKQHELFSKDQGLRIKDLQDPTKKMSKSDQTGKGVIFLSDTPDVASKKIMSATTDSEGLVIYDHKKRPGLSNLIDILALLEGISPDEVASRYQGQTMYGPLKQELADKMSVFLTDFQTRLSNVDETQMLNKLSSSESAMDKVAKSTLLRAQKAVGLR
jgi:tryptophanyl-tRNA synthetase